jgi:hypothetical protein
MANVTVTPLSILALTLVKLTVLFLIPLDPKTTYKLVWAVIPPLKPGDELLSYNAMNRNPLPGVTTRLFGMVVLLPE